MSDQDNGADLLALLQEGAPTVQIVPEFTKLVIHIAPDAEIEHSIVMQNVEFSVNTAREAISILMQLGQASGNPRFFETIATLLNSMNNANGQLLSVNNQKSTKKKEKKTLPNENPTSPIMIKNAVIMSPAEAMDQAGLIDITKDIK